MEKWWDSPTATVGALMGEKAQREAEERLKEKMQAEYERGLQEGKESAVVHAHWDERVCFNGETPDHDIFCSYCGSAYGDKSFSYCPYCGAKMDEVEGDG